MKLEHVALHVKDHTEIKNFYQDILGMELVRSFTMNQTLASDIFWLEESPQVFLMKKDHVQFEVFLSPAKYTPGFSHVCISSSHRDELMEIASKHSYRVLRLMREYSDLVFIWDHYGNAFEVKEARGGI
jgi:catechol 2,3-dioxygenase-like lactoylglutathione lyase family enzyme